MRNIRTKDDCGRIVTIGEAASRESGSLEVKNSVVALINTFSHFSMTILYSSYVGGSATPPRGHFSSTSLPFFFPR
jgi:hypothetical protein